MEMSFHGLIVRYTFWIVALYNAFDLVGSYHSFLFYNLIITNDAENNIRGYNRKTRDLIICEKLIRDLNDTFAAHFGRRVVDTNGDGGDLL